jgi:hypothetical protein
MKSGDMRPRPQLCNAKGPARDVRVGHPSARPRFIPQGSLLRKCQLRVKIRTLTSKDTTLGWATRPACAPRIRCFYFVPW